MDTYYFFPSWKEHPKGLPRKSLIAEKKWGGLKEKKSAKEEIRDSTTLIRRIERCRRGAIEGSQNNFVNM